jgi:hypothetical protein
VAVSTCDEAPALAGIVTLTELLPVPPAADSVNADAVDAVQVQDDPEETTLTVALPPAEVALIADGLMEKEQPAEN